MSDQTSTGRKSNVMTMIPRWSIESPYVILAFYVAMIGMAWFAVSRVIPRRFAPYVQSPMIGVITMMPGLSARDMELYVSNPIEQQMLQVQGIRYVRSTSESGFSIVTLEFPYGSNMQQALVNVQTQMNLTSSFLPTAGANMKPSFIVPIDPLNLPIVTLSLQGDPKKGWDMASVRQFADNTAISQLKNVDNVYAVVPFGGYRRQMQVIVSRSKLAAYHLSILDVKNAIDRYNVSAPAGRLTDGPQESIVEVDTRARNAQDIANYPIASIPAGSSAEAPVSGATGSGMGSSGGSSGSSGMGGGGGGGSAQVLTAPAASDGTSAPRVIRIRDVARVIDAHWPLRSGYDYLRHMPGTKGKSFPSIELSVIQNPAASSATVVPAVMKVVQRLEQEYPGLVFRVSYDNAHFVSILFHNVWVELGTGILLTAIAVLFFLGEWRATLITLVTLPTSLAMAVVMMLPFHMTFNSGTLIGLLLSIGRLVDDSIINVHSVERHLRMGKDPITASVDGTAEVRVPVIASTLMIVLALAPTLFSGGITQLMFEELAWPLIFALLASMVVAFTLTPLLCAALLRPEAAREADRRHPVLRLLYVLLDPSQRFLDRLEAGYSRLIQSTLRNRFLTLAGALVIVIIGFTFYNFLGSEMMPLADAGQANGVLEMSPGISFAQTRRAMRQFEQILLKYPDLHKASIEMGKENMLESYSPYYSGYGMPQANAASFMLTFSDKDSRKRSIFQLIDAIQREALATIPGIRQLQIKAMGSDVMATSNAPVSVNIYGPSLQELNHLGQQALVTAQKTPGLFQPAIDWTMGKPEYRIEIDPQRAQQAGLSPASIAEQTYYALHGGLTDTFYRLPNLRTNTIEVRYAAHDRLTPKNLDNLYLTGVDGRQIPLKSVAHIVYTFEPTLIEHDMLRRVMNINGDYRLGALSSMSVIMNLTNNIYAGNRKLGIRPINFPPGYGIVVRGDMTQMSSAFRRMLSGFAFALGLMYLVLVVQFGGFLQPLQMMASLPLELAGVFTALWLAHESFSTISILGIIILTGMDITTAVLLIDMIIRYRSTGLPRDEAISQACPQRLRPILMTSIITLLVMLPVALAPKTGMDAYQSLGTVVVGGLVMGTVLSLFVIPVMHSCLDDMTRWLNRTFLNRTN